MFIMQTSPPAYPEGVQRCGHEAQVPRQLPQRNDHEKSGLQQHFGGLEYERRKNQGHEPEVHPPQRGEAN